MSVLDWLQDVLSGKIAAQGILGQNNYDPNASFAQNALNPTALQQARDVAMGVSGGGLGTKYTLNPFGDAAEGMWRVKTPGGNDLGEVARFIETSPRSGKMQAQYGHSLQTDAPYFNTVEAAATDLRRAYADMLRYQRSLRGKGLLD